MHKRIIYTLKEVTCLGSVLELREEHEIMASVKQKLTSISNALGIEWAPLNVPLSRRLQTLALAAWAVFVLVVLWGSNLLYVLLLYSPLWWLALLYGVWMITDLDVCNKGGRPVEWVKNWSWWRYYRDYFPIKLVKTSELDPNKNYLFACYPHGVICFGFYGAFATNALNFSKVFPGMTCNLITLVAFFKIPFLREFLLSMGVCACSKESLMYLLDKKKHKGRCAALVAGGVAEAENSQQGGYQVTLRKRKGFIRIAMQSGAPLVPVISFGEIDAYRTKTSSQDNFLWKIRDKIRQITGVTIFLPTGRGIFQYSFGFMPLRTPITTVVGAPIEVERNLDPTDEEVDAVHAEFTERLVDLFESEKSKYLKNYENTHLIVT